VHAQDRGLQAFRSDHELTRYLRSLLPSAPPSAPAPPAPVAQAAAPAQPCTIPAPHQEPPPAPVDPEAERAVITGRVTDAAGCPVAGAVVRIGSLGVAAGVAPDGRYRLVISHDHFEPGAAATLTVSRVGMYPASRPVTLHPGARLTHDFQLAAATLNLEDVVVTGSTEAVSVTNSQHEGVDEGGIVKVHGDHLVILRRGRLFTVDVGGGRLEPVDAVNAFGPDVDPGGAWYDELLVSGDHVVVIGFSYARGGTEIGLFDIDRNGRLEHRSTYQMRSDDYYSSRNYASRLAEGRLILYAPVPVGDAEEVAEWMPALRRWHADADDGEFRRTLRPTRIYRAGRPLDDGDWLTLHTVTTCDLGRGELDCESTAVLGPEGRVFYVSPTAVYVWVSDWTREAGPRRASSMVYRMPLDGSEPAALGVEGTPVDQLSFLESEDDHLNVLVRSEGMGESMWASEWADGDVRLLRVPLARFADGRREAPRGAYRVLPHPAEGHHAFANRFVGRHLLYGAGNGWGWQERGGSTLYVVPWRGGELATLLLPHGVDRIEVMGGDAVVVGADATDLHFTGIRLAGEPRIAQRYVRREASQGETRTHGFFYRADDPAEGVLGLPVRGPGRPGYEHLFDESASVLFLRNTDAQFRPLGELESRAENTAEDGCVASCVDWYGNARPLFLRGRTFALLGYELVEGTLDDGRLRELRRVDFTPRGEQAAAR
ncbi:MAG TPA: beta-propeller domain-containing protein, partial [Longimicrobium sp.]|nr:beta-propeller domain-containing protein [Longimicrobium sp.]